MRKAPYMEDVGRGHRGRPPVMQGKIEMFATAPLNETFRASRAVERDTTYVRGFGSDFRERHSIRAAGARRIAGL